jgi:flagellar hook-associated protein 2
MGTVGLSFGSPTSGTGFNVSTTVASIVSNLKNVETPWNTQLTSLKAQDTAISSLGTLLSNLSTDISSLTDLQGIMAEKTGSSSDSNVLQVTAATSAASAGTHTISVTSLATTSSGYLAVIPNASDTLSGSITLQVGSGTAQTISIPSATNTLAGLATAINSSGVGVTASVLTDSAGSRLSLVSGTSGANGNITVTANGIIDTATHLSYAGAAGTDTVASVGTLTGITTAGDKLSGSISIQVGNGTAKTITIASSSNTLAKLAAAINTADTAVTATVVTNTDNTSSLQLTSNTTGTAGTLTVTSSVLDAAKASSTSLAYTSPVAGADAVLTIDGVTGLKSSSNTITNLIPGVTFQLLAPSAVESDKSLEQVQVVIGNYNTDVVTSFATMVSDYNSVVSAMNTQEGLDSSGNSEPLFGSPTLSLLQQQLMGGLNTVNPNGSLTSVTADTDTTLTGSMAITMGSGATENIVIGAVPSSGGVANTIYTGTASGYNTLSGLAATINSASGKNLSYTGTAGSSTANSTGTLTSITSTGDTLSGSLSIQVGSGTAENIVIGAEPSAGAATDTIYTGDASGYNTLAGVVSAINDATTKLTASVTVGADASGSTSATTSTATLTSNAGAVLAGKLQVLAGSGTAETIVIGAVPSGGAAANTLYTGSGVNTLSGIASTINGDTSLGLTANVTTADDGSQTLELTSGTSGSAGTLVVTPTMTATLGVTAKVVTNSDGSSSLQLTSNTADTAGTLSVIPNIYASGSGITASVVTKNGDSSLVLKSQTTGSTGALTATSKIVATSATPMSYTGTSGSTGVASTGALTGIASASDTLSGTLTIESGTGTTMEFDMSSLTTKTLTGLKTAINNAGIGVAATIVTNTNGTSSLTLTSSTTGATGNLTVSPGLLDTTTSVTTNLSYTSSSDITNLSGLGVSVNNDGTISLDVASLNSALNTDYNSVVGFFQNADSWGQTFSSILTNSGTSSTTGILALSTKANSNIESALNADISKEELLISAQSKSLTAELNSANEIMQMIPTQLDSVNELYSAITGYNQSSN